MDGLADFCKRNDTLAREVQEVIDRVLKLEKQKIHQDRPRVTKDIVTIVKEVVSKEVLG